MCVHWWVVGQGWDDPVSVAYHPGRPGGEGSVPGAVDLWLHRLAGCSPCRGMWCGRAGIETRIGTAMPAGYADLVTKGYAEEPEKAAPRRAPSRVR